MKRVLIIGNAGQDGRILQERLIREGHRVIGIGRSSSVGLSDSVDIRDLDQVRRMVASELPDEVYFLAAHHHSAEDVDENIPALLERSYEVQVKGLVNTLESLRRSAPGCRAFYAASSHVFGFPATRVQDETTPLEPRCAYGITKTAGVHACRFYRERHGLHVSVGILYNHESSYRPRRFVSQRIVHGALEALAAKKSGGTRKLTLGNLSSTADWGYAPDYVDAMTRIVACREPADFVVATGVEHTVRDFVATAFRHVGLDWTDHVEERQGIVRKDERVLIGDPAKLRTTTGWEPSVDFDGMVKILLRDAS